MLNFTTLQVLSLNIVKKVKYKEKWHFLQKFGEFL